MTQKSELGLGQEEPRIVVRPPGAASKSFWVRHEHYSVKMGPLPAPGREPSAPGIVYATAKGSNVTDVDGNRYVDLAAGFGSMLLGHGHPDLLRVVALQAERLLQALGDVYPSDAKIALSERLAKLSPLPDAKVLLGQSGADAITAALKTALLFTGKPSVVAFHGAYHGLSYAPLAACGLRSSYREPFASQLSPHVSFCSYPASDATLSASLAELRSRLARGDVGAVLVEPILGRGGVVVPPPAFLPELAELCRAHAALFIADEIWTGLGRSGKMLFSAGSEHNPDLICLGKGLGGGLPVSALIGSKRVLQAWQNEAEVVHTSTFAGAPLACAAAIATLDVLSREHLIERAAEVGARFHAALDERMALLPNVTAVRGAGLMIGVDLGTRPGAATLLGRALLERGYITSTGGGAREVLVLTPPLVISEALLFGFVDVLGRTLERFRA